MGAIKETLAKMSDALGVDFTDLGPIFEQMEWAEDEIQRAIRRHPAHKNALYHSFSMLRATHSGMATEFVFRSHCGELLDRVAAGEPTIAGTAAEVALACADTSKLAPFTTAAAGLYMRMWVKAFPNKPAFEGLELEHYEGVKGPQIDEMESEMRRKLSVKDRHLGDIECAGMHHGERVQCKYMTQDLSDAA